MSNRWRHVTTVSWDLSLAVRLTDAVTGGKPTGDPEVRVDGVEETPHRKPDGHYLFYDLPEAEVTVTVDGGEYHEDATATPDLTPPPAGSHDPGDAEEILLQPTPAYRFPSGLTRVRGTVLDGGTPVEGATVTVSGNARSVETTAGGEFVHYFEVDPANVVRYDPDPGDPSNVAERHFKPGGDHPKFEVDLGSTTFSERRVVNVGRLTTVELAHGSGGP